MDAVRQSEQHLEMISVLMDINVPKMSGVDATAHIKTRRPEIVVIGLSVQAGHEPHLAMLKAGRRDC